MKEELIINKDLVFILTHEYLRVHTVSFLF